MRLGPAPEESPAIQRQLAQALARPQQGLKRRELIIELTVGGAFLLAAGALAVLSPGGHAMPVEWIVIALIGIVLADRVAFEVGSSYTTAIQLAFVPALFVVSPAFAPLIVASGFVLGRSINVARGTWRPSRLLNSLADSWFAIGPAVVLVAAGSPTPSDVSVVVLLAAFMAQLATDCGVGVIRERLHRGASMRERFSESAWIYLVDALLSPVGFAIALAASIEPAAVLLIWPMFLLLSVFAREREDRLGSLLELSEAYRGTARVLSDVVAHDDAYTGLHIQGVAELAGAVAIDLGLDPNRRRLVEFGALLHDVGKIAIPKDIINKPGPLDELEWQVIRTHTVEGQRMLEAIGGLMSEVGKIVRWSHERFDGNGYPDGLVGEQIPIESRIVFCCDAFHAITTDRAYREARSFRDAIAELRSHAGTQFDPGVVEALQTRLGIDQSEPGSDESPTAAQLLAPAGN